jgi:hypothetical protein
MSVQLKTPDADLIYTFDWNKDLSTDPTGPVSLSADVVHTVPAPFEKVAESTNTTAGTSTIRIRGGQHGDIDVIHALAPLSTGEKIPGSFTVRVSTS